MFRTKINGRNTSYFDSVMDVNHDGNGIVAFNFCDSSHYVSFGYFARLGLSSSSWQAGTVKYIALGSNYIAPNDLNKVRAGDSTGISRDPSDNSGFWIFGEVGASDHSMNGTTWVGKIRV